MAGPETEKQFKEFEITIARKIQNREQINEQYNFFAFL
jgi:hypothetical protein